MPGEADEDTHHRSDRSEITAERLQHAMKRLRARLRSESGQQSTGLTLTQLGVLRTVLKEGPVTAARLATLEHVSPQSIAQSLAVLKAAGLVHAEPDPQDGRKRLVSADASGAELFDSLMTGRVSFLARAIDQVIEPGERRDLEKAIELMERLAAADPNARRT